MKIKQLFTRSYNRHTKPILCFSSTKAFQELPTKTRKKTKKTIETLFKIIFPFFPFFISLNLKSVKLRQRPQNRHEVSNINF